VVLDLLCSCSLSCPAVKAFHLWDIAASSLVYMQQISLDMGICLFLSFLAGEGWGKGKGNEVEPKPYFD
jgi:hypothetical protein